MKKKSIFNLIASSLMITMLSTSIALAEEDGIPVVIEYDTFECTDEEVKEYIDQSDNPMVDRNMTPGFGDYKKAFQEVKKKEEEITGSGPGGCLTIFDTYKFPKLPTEFFSFDPSALLDIGNAMLKAMQEALKDGYCQVIGGEFFEKQLDDATDYNRRLRDQGIRKKHEPWLPQVMKKQLREKFAGDVHGREKADALNFAADDQEEKMDDLIELIVDDELDEIIEN
jgi:hypothetical protein